MPTLKGNKAVISSLLLFLFLLSSRPSVVNSSSENWVEVARFSGNESTQTELITCDYQWRIKVEIVPNIITHYFFGDLLNFSIIIYPQRDEVGYVRLITMENGNWTDTIENGEWTDFSNGTSVWSNNYEELTIQNNVGKFYLNIKTELVDHYLVIVEQNTNSAQISEVNWIEVTRFSGDRIGISRTEYFSCEHVEWRIKWEYVPNVNSNWSTLNIYVNDLNRRLDSVVNTGSEITNGTLYINDDYGTYYLDLISNVPSYLIIIEQNIESIPEFPSWIILPLFIVATLVVMIGKNRLRKKGLE